MACKLCDGTGRKTCPTCDGHGIMSGRKTQSCPICSETGKVVCDCQKTPKLVIRIVNVVDKHNEYTVAEFPVQAPHDGDWLLAVYDAISKLQRYIKELIEKFTPWWVEHTEEDSGGA